MNIKKLSLMMLSVFSMAMMTNGCGSSSKEGSDSVFEAATVGDNSCLQCHNSADRLTGESKIAQYFRSAHATLNGTGCEACHGGGAQHHGVGPIPFPNPGPERCATCHTETDATEFAESKHALQEVRTGDICYRCHSNEGAVLSGINGYTGNRQMLMSSAYKLRQDRDFSRFGAINCETCHEHGGNLRPITTRDSSGNIVAFDANANRVIDQFDLCTSCHNLTTSNGTTTTLADPYHRSGSAIRLGRVITDTHYDNPATAFGSSSSGGTKIEGYVMRATGANPCADCHGVHSVMVQPESGTSIHQDWARSAHAGSILKLKDDFVFANFSTNRVVPDLAKASQRTAANIDRVTAVSTTPASAAGWEHYNWEAANRQACQRCHTSTGLVNFITAAQNNTTYTAANNNFSHLSGWNTTTRTSPQAEMLYCWGCHSNAGKGTLRDPGAITEAYAAVNNAGTGTTGSVVTIAYPDITGSNVCMSCHIGREVGANIKAITDDNGVLGFVNSHYLTAGAQLFGVSGYEYTGQSYAKPAFFQHDKVGTAAAAGTGTNGPCAGCHMTSPNGHLFTNVTKDNSGTITAITSTVCATCHTGNRALTAADLTNEEHEYVATLEVAKAALAAKGIHFANNNPYFFTAPYVEFTAPTPNPNTSFTNWGGVYGVASWQDVMGAAFNTNLLIHDPGGYAHNRFYAKRLIWDSIDFIHDGTIDGDVVEAIDAQVTAGRLSAADAAAAKTYLGTTRP